MKGVETDCWDGANCEGKKANKNYNKINHYFSYQLQKQATWGEKKGPEIRHKEMQQQHSNIFKIPKIIPSRGREGRRDKDRKSLPNPRSGRLLTAGIPTLNPSIHTSMHPHTHTHTRWQKHDSVLLPDLQQGLSPIPQLHRLFIHLIPTADKS